MDHLAFAPISRLSSLIEDGQVDPVMLTEVFLNRAIGVGKQLNAYVALREQDALADARSASERARRRRRLGALDGIPIALKDNIDVAGMPTTNGLGGAPRFPGTDADVTQRLRQAGAIILGKLNMHEAALGGTTDNPHHGRTHNPYKIGYSPGGSSGGSGAAVAAGLCAAALGTDTAGSIRLPASYCGVVGFKPTYWRISMQGIVPLNRRLDHVGPLTRTVADAGSLLEVLADSRFGGKLRNRALQSSPALFSGKTVGVLENFARETIDADVARSFEKALDLMARQGARIVRTALADFDPVAVRHAMFVLCEAGAALEHGELLGREPERFSSGLIRCIRYGSRMTAVQLLEQEREIAPAAAQMLTCLGEVDVIASPTTPQPAFSFERDGLTNLNTFCSLANFTGCPAVSLPIGCGPDGLPHGLQLIAANGRDEDLLAIAHAFEAASGPRIVPPPPFGPQA
jgi:Asp-tRNA(Asn)/Glu-tRNA(Gln) amidotransferase A subunit family amidase